MTQALTIFSVCVLTFLTFALATFARFLPAANAYRARQLSHPDARYAYVAPFHIENFAADTKEASRSYEMSPRDLAMMRSFLERAKTDAKARRQNVEQGRRDGVAPSTEPQ